MFVLSEIKQFHVRSPKMNLKKKRCTTDTIGFRISTVSYRQYIRDGVNSSKTHIKYNHDRALGRHFCWGSGAPTIWISKGLKQSLKGTSLEIHYQFSNFWGPLGPQTKFHKGPWIFRGPWPLSPGPREPYMTIKRYCSVLQTLILIVIFKMLVSDLSVYKRYIYIYEVYVVFIHVMINYEKSFHKFNWIKMTSCRFWWKKKANAHANLYLRSISGNILDV